MKIAIIADDLTGACDTGVQFVDYGLDVALAVQSETLDANKDAIIFNSDSRAMKSEQAYEEVRDICKRIKNCAFDIVYKKIDSTMRGNVGSELNAIDDIFQPDFIFITPAHPNNGRTVKNRIHYLHGTKLSETEVANDPKTPVNEADISEIIKQSSGKRVKHLSYRDLRKGEEYLLPLLSEWKQQKISYITVDAVSESDLKLLMDVVHLSYSSILCGSAGLINYLPQALGYDKSQQREEILPKPSPMLFVVGSISKVGRLQLDNLLSQTEVVGVEMDAMKMLASGIVKAQEIETIQSNVQSAIKNGKSVALYSSANLAATKAVAIEKGITVIEVSDLISDCLGEIAVSTIKSLNIQHLFLTGGDTAQQVFAKLEINEYQLIGELELGVPIGKIAKTDEIITITKAGSFGTLEVMTNAFKILHHGIKNDKEVNR
ncbi:four-carbon acid sugar kinase family protein [Gracilibacillus massiliensis]|uniref:four-carbon acid sugar kinase family protein n=1 Tax=Gracilibacillus massiliensis TaxID=1564956 RepID=UPI00071E3C0E|nr:four-carbon acid sugar kinase family protein [Gracilibacillus massiliensis]